MEPLAFQDLLEDALIVIDSAPIISVLEGHPKFAPRFMPIFAAHAVGRLRFAVTTLTIAGVLTGPLLPDNFRTMAICPDRHRYCRKRGEAAGFTPSDDGRCCSGGERSRHQRRHPGDPRAISLACTRCA